MTRNSVLLGSSDLYKEYRRHLLLQYIEDKPPNQNEAITVSESDSVLEDSGKFWKQGFKLLWHSRAQSGQHQFEN